MSDELPIGQKTDLALARDLIDRLDNWVNELASPLLPPRSLLEGTQYIRLQFRYQTPWAVMVGKLVRAASGIRAAMTLADQGFITESGALLRMVFDFCTEVTAIGEALKSGGEPPVAVREFVAQYFQPRATSVEAHAAAERTRYVSREDLMKAEIRLSQGTSVDPEKLRQVHRFLNMSYDAYAHGAYETTFELFDLTTGRFLLRGHPDPEARQLHAEAVALVLHTVISAIELTAAVSSVASVFDAAREARRAIDARDLWKPPVNSHS